MIASAEFKYIITQKNEIRVIQIAFAEQAISNKTKTFEVYKDGPYERGKVRRLDNEFQQQQLQIFFVFGINERAS